MSDLEHFKDDLERELVAAAKRRNLATNSAGPSRVKPVLVATLTAGALAIGIFGIPLLSGTKTPPAKALTLTELEHRVEIRVIDIVTDPNAVEIWLDKEFGIDAQMSATPTPDELIGVVNALGSTGMVETEVELDADDRIAVIILPAGFTGPLLVVYGRKAEPGEAYQSSATDPFCAQIYGLTVAESLDQLRALGRDLRFAAHALDGHHNSDIDPELIPSHYRLTNLLPLASDKYLVTYAEDSSTEYPEPNCQ